VVLSINQLYFTRLRRARRVSLFGNGCEEMRALGGDFLQRVAFVIVSLAVAPRNAVQP